MATDLIVVMHCRLSRRCPEIVDLNLHNSIYTISSHSKCDYFYERAGTNSTSTDLVEKQLTNMIIAKQGLAEA